MSVHPVTTAFSKLEKGFDQVYAQNIPFWPDTKDNVLQSVGHFVSKNTTNASNTKNEGKKMHLFITLLLFCLS